MSEATDPLNLGINLDEVETGRPVLPKGVYSMRIDQIQVLENSAGTGRNLVVDFATTQPMESTKGQQVNPGFHVRNYYPLQPSENNPDSDFWKQNLARLQDAVQGTERGQRGVFNPYDFKDQNVLVTLDIETSEEFGDQNRIKKLSRLDEE